MLCTSYITFELLFKAFHAKPTNYVTRETRKQLFLNDNYVDWKLIFHQTTFLLGFAYHVALFDSLSFIVVSRVSCRVLSD